MSGIESAEELIALIREHDDIANHGRGCAPEMLERAEAELGVPFPPSYRRLVAEFGTWDIAGQEFLGVYQTPAMGNELLGSVRHTKLARQHEGLPEAMIVTMFDGMGGFIVLDTDRPGTQNEAPVLAWTAGAGVPAQTEEIARDFGSYALDLCKRAVGRWRTDG